MLLSGSFSTFGRSNNRVYDMDVYQKELNNLRRKVTKKHRIYRIKRIVNLC
jgi:hypothetical protein